VGRNSLNLRRLAMGAIALVACVSMLTLAPGKAAAAAPWTAPCSLNGCNGKDAYYKAGSNSAQCAVGFSANGVVYNQVSIKKYNGPFHNAYVELAYSTGCKTAWAMVVGGSTAWYFITVQQTLGGYDQQIGTSNQKLYYQGAPGLSKMTYDGPGYLARAGAAVCANQWNACELTTWTGSY